MGGDQAEAHARAQAILRSLAGPQGARSGNPGAGGGVPGGLTEAQLAGLLAGGVDAAQLVSSIVNGGMLPGLMPSAPPRPAHRWAALNKWCKHLLLPACDASQFPGKQVVRTAPCFSDTLSYTIFRLFMLRACTIVAARSHLCLCRHMAMAGTSRTLGDAARGAMHCAACVGPDMHVIVLVRRVMGHGARAQMGGMYGGASAGKPAVDTRSGPRIFVGKLNKETSENDVKVRARWPCCCCVTTSCVALSPATQHRCSVAACHASVPIKVSRHHC